MKESDDRNLEIVKQFLTQYYSPFSVKMTGDHISDLECFMSRLGYVIVKVNKSESYVVMTWHDIVVTLFNYRDNTEIEVRRDSLGKHSFGY